MSSERITQWRTHLPGAARALRVGETESQHTCQCCTQLLEANARIDSLEARIQHEVSAVSILQREHADAKDLAERRGKELIGAQVFLTKADRLSISEVSELIHTLNEEILDVAFSLSTALAPQQYVESQRTAALPIVTEFMGPNMTSLLVTESCKDISKVNSRLGYTAIRMFLVYFCSRLVEEWCPGDKAKSRMLDDIYEGMRATENQSVYGRWRALTRSRLTVDMDTWRDNLLTGFGDLLITAGWRLNSETHYKKFEQNLKLIGEVAQKARSGLGEMVTSADLRVIAVVGGADFNGAYMDISAHGPKRNAPPMGPIAGTTGMGLKKDTQDRFACLIPAEVILESTLREALQPSTKKIGKEAGLRKTFEPGAAHTAVPQTSLSDGAEQRATRNPFQS